MAPGATTADPPPAGQDGGLAPESLRSDREVPADSPHESSRDLLPREPARDPRELAGYELQVVLHMGEGPPAPKNSEASAAAIDTAHHRAEVHLTIDASASRARFVLSSGFLLPAGTELRARTDRYGHVLLLPGDGTYRIAEAGALRALFEERRLDVAPASPVETRAAGDGTRRLNLRTRRLEVTTRAAKATLELATLRDAGDGGALVCRWLLDLMAGRPSGSPCGVDEVPLHAELRWTTQGTLVFDVSGLTRRVDLAAQDMAAPPASASFIAGPPPSSPGEALVARAELAAFRTGPQDVPPAAAGDAQAPPPESGLVLQNGSDALRVAWLDGVPVAWVGPGGRVALPSLQRGRYTLQSRSFLGDAWEPPQTVTAPGQADVGTVDPPSR